VCQVSYVAVAVEAQVVRQSPGGQPALVEPVEDDRQRQRAVAAVEVGEQVFQQVRHGAAPATRPGDSRGFVKLKWPNRRGPFPTPASETGSGRRSRVHDTLRSVNG